MGDECDMRISFDLDEEDIQRFRKALERVGHSVRCADEHDLVEAAKYALDHLPLAVAPRYVREQMQRVQHLIMMLEDEVWALPMPERGYVLKVLAYVADPDDMIPDHIEVIGLLDDAIMLQLLMRDLHHVLPAWRDFCRSRITLGTATLHRQAHMRRAARLARRRVALLARMRRRAVRNATHAKRSTADDVRGKWAGVLTE